MINARVRSNARLTVRQTLYLYLETVICALTLMVFVGSSIFICVKWPEKDAFYVTKIICVIVMTPLGWAGIVFEYP